MIFPRASTWLGLLAPQLLSVRRLTGHLLPMPSVADHTWQLRAHCVGVDWDFSVQPWCPNPALQTLLPMAPIFLKVLDIVLWRNVLCLCFHRDFPVGHSPSRVLLEYLVDANLERFIIEAFADVILIYPELGSRHRFPLWDSGEIKPELSVVAALMVKLSVMLHWNRKTAH